MAAAGRAAQPWAAAGGGARLLRHRQARRPGIAAPDRWIGAGLDALLRVRAAQLAPGLDRPAPLLDVVEVLAATHLETFGPGVFPLPLCRCPPLPKSRPPPCARPRLAASLAAVAADPDHVDASLLELALMSGFLRRGAEGSLLPGPARRDLAGRRACRAGRPRPERAGRAARPDSSGRGRPLAGVPRRAPRSSICSISMAGCRSP